MSIHESPAESHWRTDWLSEAVASHIRIAAISIAAYDYIMTLPAEWRFYRNQKSWRFSPGCILFILIRYISVVCLTVSTVGYFAQFSPRECQRFYILAPIFKLLQTMVSQVILGIRTANISGRSPRVSYTLLTLFVVLTGGQWFSNLFSISHAQNKHHNCQAVTTNDRFSAWNFYVLAIFYDIVTLSTSTFYMLRYAPPSGRMSRLVKLMFLDGIGYFVVLTAVNSFNLILFHTSNQLTQASGACLGEAVTWIMSQKILIHLRDAAAEHQRTTHVVSQPLQTARSISYAIRSQFEHKDQVDEEFNFMSAPVTPDAQSISSLFQNLSDIQLDVRVQIEHSVTVEYNPNAHEPGTHRTPRVIWCGDATASVKQDASGS